MVRERVLEHVSMIEFFDHIGNEVTRIGVAEPTTIEPSTFDSFPSPVDRSYRIRTDHVSLQQVPMVVLRDQAGNPIEKHPGGDDEAQTPRTVELCTPLKLYVQPSNDVELVSGLDELALTFPSTRWIHVGVRAPRKTPSGTVTTTPAVEDVFAAIGTFGASIGTGSPSRSFPSDRRHPPTIEFGQELNIPDRFERHDSRIEVNVPASYLCASIAAPLAYYLGATLVPSPSPGISIDGEITYRIESQHTLVDECHALLRRCLLLDGAIAADRVYDFELDARRRLSRTVDVDWQELADLSSADRLIEYLKFPRKAIQPLLPNVHQPVYVTSSQSTIESLPYLANDLASVRPAVSTEAKIARADGGLLRHPRPNRPRSTVHHPGRKPIDVQSIGERLPIGRHPAYPRAFQNRVDRTSTGDSISITVACNDMKMRPELDRAGSTYASRDTVPIDVTVYEDLSTDDLAAALSERTDYFHYIGHIEDEGFLCADDYLDVHDLDDIGVELFFLNSCESIHQAVGLIRAGACGGIATHQRIKNRLATRVGASIAEALTRGFPLGVSLDIVQSAEGIRDTYSVVGDPKLDLTATESQLPYTCHVRSRDEGIRLFIETHLTKSVGAGSICTFRCGEDLPHFLHPTRQTFDLDLDALIRFLELEEVPVWVEGELMWSQEAIDALAQG